MSYRRKFEGQPTSSLPICMNLRSKAIYVTGNPDPQCEAEEGSTRFNCWCNVSQHVTGPDHQLVDRNSCTPGRECFVSRG